LTADVGMFRIVLNKMKNNRGIALLIVLLVTALLIALIFEFAYATRISLNSAVNFRDSQRAYFLARSGIYAFIKYGDLKKNIPQGEWSIVPLISEGDTLVRIMWEDEQGKINISRIRRAGGAFNPTYNWLVQLFTNKSIDQSILDKISDDQRILYLPAELHQVMTDEDFTKLEKYVTTMTTMIDKININTASREVLESLGINGADSIVSARESQPFSQISDVRSIMQIDDVLAGYLTYSSTIYKVYAYATVGGYTKRIEAIVNTSDGSILYWRAL